MLRLALDVPVMLRRRYPGRRRRRSGSARSHGSSSWRSRSTISVQNSASGRSELDQASSEGPALGADNAQQSVVDERVDSQSGSSKAPAAPAEIVSAAEALSKAGDGGRTRDPWTPEGFLGGRSTQVHQPPRSGWGSRPEAVPRGEGPALQSTRHHRRLLFRLRFRQDGPRPAEPQVQRSGNVRLPPSH